MGRGTYREMVGAIAGAILGLVILPMASGWVMGMLIGLGVGILVKRTIQFPDFHRAPTTDILTLMSDPYASPLRGQPVKLEGTLIGRGDAGYSFGSDLKLQDPTGMLFVRYASRFGPIGNFFFGAKRVNALLGTNGSTLGWFRRGIAPWMDLVQYTSGGQVINSYHRFWSLILGIGCIVAGIVLPMVVG